MSALHARLAHHHAAGHAQPLADPFVEFGEGDAPHFRPAAVLIAITQRPSPGVLLLHRPETMRAHPGQVAFPGGRLDAGETVEAAAFPGAAPPAITGDAPPFCSSILIASSGVGRSAT